MDTRYTYGTPSREAYRAGPCPPAAPGPQRARSRFAPARRPSGAQHQGRRRVPTPPEPPCTNKPKAQLPAEKFSSHFSGPEATADLGGHPPAMCDDMGRSLCVEPLHSVLARAPNQRSGTWPYAPPATSLWVKQVTAIQPEPIPPKDDQQGLRPSSLCHISCCAYDRRTTQKAI